MAFRLIKNESQKVLLQSCKLHASTGAFKELARSQLSSRAISGATATTSAPERTGQDDMWYKTHMPLHNLQRAAVAVFSAVGAAYDPKRADLVAALGETTGLAAFQRMQMRMQQSLSGRQILEEKPRITNEVLAYAASLPPGTFGHEYGRFMGRRHFEANDRPPVRFIDDPELAYVAQRARETHDLWHVLFGCPTTVVGELALKAVEFVQTGLPMAALSVVGAQWRLKSEDRQRLNAELIPWALQAGSRCADLMCLRYEEHFKDDLQQLRQQWRIHPAPFAARMGAQAEGFSRA